MTCKRVLIISPQPWGDIHVSKHHYAVELCRMGYQVTFLNPMKLRGTRFNITHRAVIDVSNLMEAFVELPIPSFLRFRLRALYDIAIDFFSSKIARRLGGFDIVWCFDPNYFHNLKRIAPIVIYHPVDPVIYPFQLASGKSADIILSVSEEILKPFRGFKAPQHFVNHGVSEEYEKLALRNLLKNHDYNGSQKLKFGYVGNLLRREIDWDIIFTIIDKHEGIEFNFWGPYAVQHAAILAGDFSDETRQRIECLRSFKNVILHGSIPSSQMPGILNQMDGFLLVYKYIPGQSDRSNSHKILEYFCTGKVLVSFNLKAYDRHRDLLVMPEGDDDNEIPALFDKVVDKIAFYNSPEHIRRRLEFALGSTYRRNIMKIERLLCK